MPQEALLMATLHALVENMVRNIVLQPHIIIQIFVPMCDAQPLFHLINK